jgi:replication factor C subunit 2/4
MNAPSSTCVLLIFSMTSAAQQALRRTMEIYSNTTRFALACNVSSKIIEPIQSRCAILRYTRLGDEQVLKRLMDVIKAEGVRTPPRDLHARSLSGCEPSLEFGRVA